MVSIDQILIEVVQKNFMTISLGLAILKLLALETKTTVDDKIVTMLLNIFQKHKK